MTTPFRPATNGAPACNLNENDPDEFVAAPLSPPIEWFTSPPEWMTEGYGASVALCGEDAGRVAMYVAEFAKPFHNPYTLPNGTVLKHHPRGVGILEAGWNNPISVIDEDGTPTIITAGLFGFEHSPDPSPAVDSFDSLAAEALDFHTTVRQTDLGDVRKNPLAALANVVWGENEIGPYMIGALSPNVKYRDAAVLFSSQVSTELLFDGRNFFALPAAAIPVGNAQRSRIAAATSHNGPRQYALRVLAAATMVAEVEESDCGCSTQTVEEEEEIMADVDLSAIEKQLGALAEAMGAQYEAIDKRFEAITPEPEPVPEAWESPLAEAQTTLTERLDETAETLKEIVARFDEFDTRLAGLSAAVEDVVDLVVDDVDVEVEVSSGDDAEAVEDAVEDPEEADVEDGAVDEAVEVEEVADEVEVVEVTED